MKKLTILTCIFIQIIELISMEIINNQKIYKLDINDLSNLPQIEVTTERQKDENIREDLWKGPALSEILTKYNITSYDQLKFTAIDNYMVRLEKQDIETDNPIIALQKNHRILAEEKVRLIVPSRRDMYWVMNIKQIEVLEYQQLTLPAIIYNGNYLLDGEPLTRDPEPFINCIGYRFDQILGDLFPSKTGDFLLVSYDGINHILDYEKYLSRAVLILEDDQLILKSPQMPAGMWLKDLIYIQNNEIAILITKRVNSISRVVKLMNWIDPPDQIKSSKAGELITNSLNKTFDPSEVEKIEFFLISP